MPRGGRSAAGGEEQTWVNLLMNGQSEEAVLSDILGVPHGEFYNRAQTLFSSGTADQRYVEALYLVLLNRIPSGAEAAGWVSALPSAGLHGVALGFLQSGEFRTDQFEAYYNALLHRPSDSPGLAGWVSSGLDVGSARIAFEASNEFYTNG